jgi:hypothetical protein
VRLASRPRQPSRWQAAHTNGEFSLPRAPHSTGPPSSSTQRGPTGRSSGPPTDEPGPAPQPTKVSCRGAGPGSSVGGRLTKR